MFYGIYYAQKKISDQWVPTTTVFKGDTYRYWDPCGVVPTSLAMVASHDMHIEEPLEVDHSCEICGKSDALHNMESFVWPTGEPSVYCQDCYASLLKMAKKACGRYQINFEAERKYGEDAMLRALGVALPR